MIGSSSELAEKKGRSGTESTGHVGSDYILLHKGSEVGLSVCRQLPAPKGLHSQHCTMPSPCMLLCKLTVTVTARQHLYIEFNSLYLYLLYALM